MRKLSSKNHVLFRKLMREARKLAKEVPHNPTCALYLDVPDGTPPSVEDKIVTELDKMGWENLQVITTETSHALTFMRK